MLWLWPRTIFLSRPWNARESNECIRGTCLMHFQWLWNTRRTTMTTERRQNTEYMCKSSSALRIQYIHSQYVFIWILAGSIALVGLRNASRALLLPACTEHIYCCYSAAIVFFFLLLLYFSSNLRRVCVDRMDGFPFGIWHLEMRWNAEPLAFGPTTRCTRCHETQVHFQIKLIRVLRRNENTFGFLCGRARTSERNSLTHFVSIIYWKFSTIGWRSHSARAEPPLIIEREFLKRFIPNLHWSRLSLTLFLFFFFFGFVVRASMQSTTYYYQFDQLLPMSQRSRIPISFSSPIFTFSSTFNWNE